MAVGDHHMPRHHRRRNLRQHFILDAQAVETLKYFLVLAAFILLVVVLIILFKGLRASAGG